MQSDSHNLKYMGIDALGRLIKISPEIAEQHQLAVIDCLEVRDIFLSNTFVTFTFQFDVKLLVYCLFIMLLTSSQEPEDESISVVFVVFLHFFL